ncbi:MAG: ATP-binding protein [Limisphaerales bacterium]
MCDLKHNGGKSFFTVALGIGTFAIVSILVAPAVIGQSNWDFPPNEGADSKEQNPALTLRAVKINNRELSGVSNESVDLPSHPGITTFTFGPDALASNVPIRFRCQLDGYEQGWHERSLAMRVVIRFIDANQSDIAEKAFAVSGESPGWTGSFTNSPWVHRKEVITVPTGAVHFWVVMTSAGPPEAVGVFAVRNLVVRPSQGDTNVFWMIPSVTPDASKAAVEENEISPTGWSRGGIRPSNAKLLRYGFGSEVALAILDDYPNGHADWNTDKIQGPGLTPGEKLTFEWDEVYSIGAADYGEVIYTNLPAGLYRFRMEALNLYGLPTGGDISLLVTVPVAFWKTIWFWVAAGVSLFGLAAGGWRLAESRKMKRQVKSLERERVLEQERFRIAQDIHDDLGARVAQISLLSSAAQEKESLSVAEARVELGMVSRMSRELVAALYETVWAVSPENDHLDSLVSYVCQLTNQMCAVANLKCRFEIPDMPPAIFLASNVRHNLVMTIKEAIHNVIKHGHASEIQISIQHTNGVLSIQVSDNGCGFEAGSIVHGNGLDNMERRLRSMGGRCSVKSQPGAGTKVNIELPLPVS